MASEQDVVVLPVDQNVDNAQDDPRLGTLTDTSFATCAEVERE